WLPRGASLNLFEAAQDALAPNPRLTCRWNTSVARLEKAPAGWRLIDPQGITIMTADKVIIAAALEAKNLAASIDVRLPLRPVRGQLSIFSIDEASSWAPKLPRTAISGDGYCLPAKKLPDGSYQWIVGSSFDEGESELHDWDTSDDFNREQAKGLLDYEEGDVSHLHKSGSFVGVRCTSQEVLSVCAVLQVIACRLLGHSLNAQGYF
ncbi:MAG: hypothetical protein RL551_624, partial [Pseudomonadota bacterium]